MAKLGLENYNVITIGLGFVGLTLSLKLSQHKRILGIETDKAKLKSLKNNSIYFYEPGLGELLIQSKSRGNFLVYSSIEEMIFQNGSNLNNSIYIITVGTAVLNGDQSSDIIFDLIKTVQPHLKPHDHICFRSTISVGTSRRVFQYLYDNRLSVDVSFCPERTIEGNALNELSLLPQIVSSTSDQGKLLMSNLFGLITEKIIIANDLESAELAKLISNVERDVYFGFANEVGLIARDLEVDFAHLKSLVTEDYPRSNLKNIAPVGGPCLEKDSYILLEALDKTKYKNSIFLTSRKSNENWIKSVSSLLAKRYSQKTSICLTGLAFKSHPATDDLRGSLAMVLYQSLKMYFNEVYLYDPNISTDDIYHHFNTNSRSVLSNVKEVIERCDLCISQNGDISILSANDKIELLDLTTFNYDERVSRLF